MAKTAAVFFADGFEEIEGLSPVDYLRRAGVEVTTIGVVGKPFNDTMIVTSSHKIPIIPDTTLDSYLTEHKDNLPDCVVCPGGSVGADNLAATKPLLAFLEKCFDAGKLTAALCASPAVVLGKTNILSGKSTGKIFAMDKNLESLYAATDSEIINKGFLPEETKKMLALCDIIFICLYPGATLNFLKENKNNFKNDSIITDISGVKTILEKSYNDICPPNADFIFGHPMAGGEKEGFLASKGEYFLNHNY